MKKPTIHTKKGTLTLIESGIIKMVLKENSEWNLEDAKETHEANLKLSDGKKFCLCLIANKFFIPTKEAQAYISSKECTDYRIASAFVIKNTAMKLLGNLFVKVFKSKSPTQLFSSEEDAMKWMRPLLKNSDD